MRLHPYLLTGLVTWLAAGSLPAQSLPDPLRLIPAEADLFVKIEQPRRLLDAVLGSEVVKQLQNLDAVKEQYDSTNFRRFLQLVSYFEKQLGVSRDQLLEQLTAGGAVAAIKFGPDPAPALLVVQGRDEELLRRFVRLALEVIEQELARQESKDRIEKGKYRNISTYRIGKDAHYAAAGAVLMVSNNADVLKRGIDLYLDGDAKSVAKVSSVAEARRLLDSQPPAWLWLNLETVHKAPQAKDVFALKRNDSQLTVIFGGWLDVAGRSPFLCAGLYPGARGFTASLRMPRGREGFPTALAAHLPAAGRPASRPLLDPPGTLFSASYYLDISGFWQQRKELFNDKQLKSLEEFDKNTEKFLAGARLSKLLAQAGPYQRLVVVAQQPRQGSKIMPAINIKTTLTQNVPPFALVLEMREPDTFFKRMDAILRSAAFLLTTQVSLKKVEENYKGHKIIAYRFSEDARGKELPVSYRYDFSPCFTRAGNQFVAAYNLDLCRNLIDLLDQEAQRSGHSGSDAALQQRIYASGVVKLLESYKDRLYTQTMLGQAMSPEKANEQVVAFLDWLRRLGTLQIETHYRARDFRYDLRFERPPAPAREVTSR
jgi:hypothetical protein